MNEVLAQEEHKLANLFSQEKLNVVLAEFGSTGTRIMYPCEKAGIPLVVHFHGADAYRQRSLNRFGMKYKTLFRIANAIVVVSQDMRRQLKELGAPDDKIHYNPCGVDSSFFEGAHPHKAPPLFLSVARFVKKKGHFFTLMAFKKLLEHCPEAELVLIGDGPLRKHCVLLTRKLKITGSVKFICLLPPLEIVGWMRKARAYVQHSIRASDGDSEGTPVSILEAGACGLPVVSTKHNGISEAVIHDKTGFLVNEKDIDSMAEYMLKLTRTPELAMELGKNARAWIIKSYSQEKSIKTLYQILVNASRN